MNIRMWLLVPLALVALSIAACKKRQVAIPPPPQPKNLVVLLPDPAGGSSGITVSNAGGRQEINESYKAVRIQNANVAPSAPFVMSQEEVRRIFGAALDALPAPEVLFVLYFKEATDELTPESEALIPALLKAVQDRHSTDVTITGHTDTTGDTKSNYALGLKRAERVAAILASKGFDTSLFSTTSLGESDLAVKTGKGVAEQRNRRVEVVVR